MRKCSKPDKYIYLIMNKPCGYVCSAVSDSHKTVYELLSPELQELVQCAPRGQRLHTVGRLDCDTSGLLLVTNDGRFSHRITTGEDVTKTYLVTLSTPVDLETQKFYVSQVSTGIKLPPEKKYGEQLALPAILEFESSCICNITLNEGKFHEVRRIFRALGNEVKELERISIGNLQLPKELKPGKWRELTDTEIKLFMFF